MDAAWTLATHDLTLVAEVAQLSSSSLPAKRWAWFPLVKIPTEKSPGMRLRMNFLSLRCFLLGFYSGSVTGFRESQAFINAPLEKGFHGGFVHRLRW
jgi:hypothetical protein